MVEPSGRPAQGSWRQLLSGRHLPVMVVLAGGVALYATNVYLATSLLPSAVAEIGGQRLYAWNTTVFLLASVGSSVLLSRLLRTVSSRGTYLLALGLFVGGTLICTAAPTIIMLLVGRTVQGAGGGLLAGLAYGLIRSTLPAQLWARGIALTSAMWGVGTLVGPAIGGALAEFASWRDAFAVLAAAAGALGIVVPRALSQDRPQTEPEAVPVISLLLVVAAALAVSGVSVVGSPLVSVIGVGVGVLLVVGLLWHERSSLARVFPAATFAPGSSLRWIYATLAALAIGSTIEGFVPLFGQQLAGLAPLAAAFLGAALAAGWTLGQIPSAGATSNTSVRRLTVAGPIALTISLTAATLVLHARTEGWALLGWALALLAAGAGIGVAWPHLSTSAMGSVADPPEGNKAATAINTVQLLANAFGASLTGVLVNLGGTDPLTSAHYLFAGIAVVTVLGVISALISSRRSAEKPQQSRRPDHDDPSGGAQPQQQPRDQPQCEGSTRTRRSVARVCSSTASTTSKGTC